MSGPAPKRDSERRRRNKPETPTTTGKMAAPVIPNCNGKWHKTAQQWYKSLKKSGQAQWYTDSDWSYAYYIAEMMSRTLNDPESKAALVASVMSGCNDLLVSEGARRRLRVELEREAPKQKASVTLMNKYKEDAV